MKSNLKNWGRNLLSPLTNLFIKLKITANFLTIASLPVSILASYFIAYHNWLLSIIFIIIVALLDTLDGEIARKTGTIHKKGAFLDSVLDRISEFFIFLGFFLFYYPEKLYMVLVISTMFTSLLISYIRARAEGLGNECKIGIFERPVRFMVIILGLIILRYSYFHFALLTILIGNIITIFQRLFYVLK